MNNKKTRDLIIIGAGPAGLAASIYASRYGIDHSILGQIVGGQISETNLIDNYPGIEDMSGFDFAQKWGKHAKKYGVEIIPELARSIEKTEKLFKIETQNNAQYEAKTVLLASGTTRRKLNIAGEQEFQGKGISYCATCDGFFYKNKIVAVIGGSDSAAGAALYLSGICQKVYLIYRKEQLRCEPYWEKLIRENQKIEIIYNTNVTEVFGSEKLAGIKLDRSYKNNNKLEIDGLFIEAGSAPDMAYAGSLGLETDGEYIKINADCSTSVEGAWAAGDITNGSDKFRQVITAAAEGAIAARSIFNYLKTQK